MQTRFDPARSDFITRFLFWIFPRNPLLIILFYSAMSIGGTAILAHFHGSALPTKNTHTELFEDYPNLINFGVVIPIGVWLVSSFYSRLQSGLQQIVDDRIVVFETTEHGHRFLQSLDRSLNRPWFSWFSLSLAIAFNVVFLLGKQNAWNDMNGGLPSWWFRLFAVINFYILFIVTIKGFVVVSAIRRLFGQKITLQPLHPDGCGGLRSIGNIALTLNYLVCLVAVYLTVLAFIARTPLEHPLFLPIVLVYIAMAGYLFFVPLARAHDLMEREKRIVLSVLNAEFQDTYARVAANVESQGIPLADAQKIEALERLYRIASRMPVWPLDTRIIAQFAFAVALPLIVGTVIELMREGLQAP